MASLLYGTQRIPLTLCDASRIPVSRVIFIPPPGGMSTKFLVAFRPRAGGLACAVPCRWSFTARDGLPAAVVG